MLSKKAFLFYIWYSLREYLKMNKHVCLTGINSIFACTNIKCFSNNEIYIFFKALLRENAISERLSFLSIKAIIHSI